MRAKHHPDSKLNPIVYWLLCHSRAFLFALGDMVRTPFSSTMTLLVIAIAMALPAGLYVLLQNFQQASEHWSGSPTITLYLRTHVSGEQAHAIMQQLQSLEQVQSSRYISPEEGVKEFERVTRVKNILTDLGYNPIPSVIVVSPKPEYETPQALQQLSQTLQRNPLIDVIQLDVDWVKRLYYIVTLGKRATYTLALLLGLGVILIIGNTMRLISQNHQAEITVLRLVGATSGFIRRPLIYRGVLYGVFGGLIAWIMLSIAISWLRPPALALARTYDNLLIIEGISFFAGCCIVACCALLAYIGTWLAVTRHLMTSES